MSETESKKAHILQLAWAAGVMDARMFFPKSGYLIRMETVDEAMAKRFHKTVGVGGMTTRLHPAMKNQTYIYQCNNAEDSHKLLKMLAPFLSGKKMKQCGELLARIERSPAWQKKMAKKAASSATDPAEE